MKVSLQELAIKVNQTDFEPSLSTKIQQLNSTITFTSKKKKTTAKNTHQATNCSLISHVNALITFCFFFAVFAVYW